MVSKPLCTQILTSVRFSMVCIQACGCRQAPKQTCQKCQKVLGAYFCGICNLFDDDGEKKQIYHCSGCNICRVGGRENFFHCDKCVACYAISMEGNHVCIENSLAQNCPVCLEYLFDSREQLAILPCGHALHRECHSSMLKSGALACPVCQRSSVDLSDYHARLREEIARTPMPEEYRDRQVSILCADCQAVSHHVTWHAFGIECPRCGSFNTHDHDPNDTRTQGPGTVEDAGASGETMGTVEDAGASGKTMQKQIEERCNVNSSEGEWETASGGSFDDVGDELAQ